MGCGRPPLASHLPTRACVRAAGPRQEGPDASAGEGLSGAEDAGQQRGAAKQQQGSGATKRAAAAAERKKQQVGVRALPCEGMGGERWCLVRNLDGRIRAAWLGVMQCMGVA